MNSVDPDQMQHSAASGLGLHCLPMSLLWEARHKLVKKLLWGLNQIYSWETSPLILVQFQTTNMTA